METLATPQAMVALQSRDHGDLLNIIDNLRSQGISHYVDLPQIIVCGNLGPGGFDSLGTSTKKSKKKGKNSGGTVHGT
jgi:hypothetical protein